MIGPKEKKEEEREKKVSQGDSIASEEIMGGGKSKGSTEIKSLGNTLSQDASLKPNEQLVSNNGRYKLVYQLDGNLVAYDNEAKDNYGHPAVHKAVWSTGKITGPGRTVMQNDGNLVCYDSKNEPYWSSETVGKGKPSYGLVVQDDGNIVLYDSTGKPTWAM